MKISKFTVITIFIFFPFSVSFAQTQFQDIETDQLQIVEDKEFIKTDLSSNGYEQKKVLEDILKEHLLVSGWDPEEQEREGSLVFNGKSQWKTPPKCSEYAIERIIHENKDSFRKQGTAIKNFVKRCHNDLLQSDGNRYLTLLKFLKVRYNFQENPSIKPVKLTLEDGTIVRGFLGLKRSRTPRPMVIARCGMFCDADSNTSGKMMLMHFFDEAPFNVLFLGNSTGSYFHRDNHRIALGGFDEGMQFLRTAKLLDNHPTLSKRISSFHISAVSKASHGALFAGLFNSYRDRSYPKINSIIAMCPVVDLEYTLHKSFNESIRRNIFAYLVRSVIKKAYPFVPGLREMLPDVDDEKPQNIKKAIVTLAVDNYQEKDIEWPLSPFKETVIDNKSHFWETNNYLDNLSSNKTPTLVIGSQNDPTVLYNDNTKKLERKLLHSPNPYVKVIKLNSGSHCAQSINYSRSVFSSLYRNFILSHSPEMADYKKKNLYLGKTLSSVSLKRKELFLDSAWEILHGKNYANLHLKIWRKGRAICKRKSPYKDRRFCFRNTVVRVPLKKLAPTGLTRSRNSVEAEVMTRWANTHVKLIKSHQGPRQSLPKSISWRGSW